MGCSSLGLGVEPSSLGALLRQLGVGPDGRCSADVTSTSCSRSLRGALQRMRQNLREGCPCSWRGPVAWSYLLEDWLARRQIAAASAAKGKQADPKDAPPTFWQYVALVEAGYDGDREDPSSSNRSPVHELFSDVRNAQWMEADLRVDRAVESGSGRIALRCPENDNRGVKVTGVADPGLALFDETDVNALLPGERLPTTLLRGSGYDITHFPYSHDLDPYRMAMSYLPPETIAEGLKSDPTRSVFVIGEARYDADLEAVIRSGLVGARIPEQEIKYFVSPDRTGTGGASHFNLKIVETVGQEVKRVWTVDSMGSCSTEGSIGLCVQKDGRTCGAYTGLLALLLWESQGVLSARWNLLDLVLLVQTARGNLATGRRFSLYGMLARACARPRDEVAGLAEIIAHILYDSVPKKERPRVFLDREGEEDAVAEIMRVVAPTVLGALGARDLAGTCLKCSQVDCEPGYVVRRYFDDRATRMVGMGRGVRGRFVQPLAA